MSSICSCTAPPLEHVVLDGIGYVKRSFRLDVACCRTLSEGDAVHDVVRLGIDQFQFDVLLLASHHLRRAEVIDILRAEDRFRVARSKRSEALEVVVQLLRDILEVDERVDVEESLRLLRLDVAIHIGLESVAKLPHVAPAQRQSCRVGMAAEVEQQVAAALDGRVDIKSRHAPSRSCRQVSLARDDHGGAEVDLCQSAGYDAHHALLPVFVVEDDAARWLWLSSRFTIRLASSVICRSMPFRCSLYVSMWRALRCASLISRSTSRSTLSLPHSMRPLALMRGPILKMISLIDSSRPLSPHVHDGLEADAGVLVELLQSVESQDAVLVHHGHEVCCDAHGTEVEQRDEAREGNAVVLGKGLHKLESHAAATELLERVGVVRPLRVERRHGTRQFVVRHVVVTDDEVNAQLLGVCYLFHSLDATVEDDDEFHPRLLRILQSFVADAIPPRRSGRGM